MKIIEAVLAERHEAKPVHTAEEMELLATRFPQNIKLFASYKDGVMLAGCLIYESTNVAHAQYMANSNEGCDMGALDLIIDFLVNDYHKDKEYFDFGISNENMGRVLNAGLIAQKEGFGARAVVHDFYQLTL